MKQLISKIIKEALKKEKVDLTEEQIENLIEIPPTTDMGDFAFPCFALAGKLKMPPQEIAINIRAKIGNIPEEFSDIQTKGPYVNFFLDRKTLAINLMKQIAKQGEEFGKNKEGKNQKILVEFSSPNIAKPFGIGHLRSTIIGNSVAKISEANGYKTIRVNYLGDWGTQFGKLIFGYKKFGKADKLKKDPIKYLLGIYVKSNKKSYEEKAREEFRKLENGDKENLKLWKQFRELSLKDFEKIYQLLGVKFDSYLGESMYEDKMKKVVEELKAKKLLIESEGALIVDLQDYNLGVALIQKSDGATLYSTRDLASAISRYEEFNFNKMFYEVGQEQTLHLSQVFKILELMGYDWAKECVHIQHGLYLDSDGKRFATRKGKTIFMEEIINKTKTLAEKEIKKRFPDLSKKEISQRAQKVAIAAILYGDLKNNRANNMVFDIKRFVSFEGDTGPYLLYSYARANSILRKAKTKKQISLQDFEEDLEKSETDLVIKLSQFPEITRKSFSQLNPSLIANYSYQLAQIFNEFYHACPVIDSEKQIFRLALVESFKQVLKNSLNLLGIETLERM